MTTSRDRDTEAALKYATLASTYLLPIVGDLKRTEEGVGEVVFRRAVDAIEVRSWDPIPCGGGWTASHGPFYCNPAKPDEWIAYTDDEGIEAYVVFESLAAALEAASAEQKKEQRAEDRRNAEGVFRPFNQ